MMTISLYDDKSSCELCSTTFVRRRYDDQADHAREHLDAGDAIVVQDDEYFVEVPE